MARPERTSSGLSAACLALGVLSLAPLASAQSLAEAAAREKARRAEAEKAGKKPVVVTNEDLEEKSGSKPAATAETQAASAAAARKSRGDQKEENRRGSAWNERKMLDPADEKIRQRSLTEAEKPPPTESEWKQEAEQRRSELASAQAEQGAIQTELERLNGRLLLSTDTFEMMNIRRDKEGLEARMTGAKARAAEAQLQMDAFQERARRAGIPPGWVREP